MSPQRINSTVLAEVAAMVAAAVMVACGGCLIEWRASVLLALGARCRLLAYSQIHLEDATAAQDAADPRQDDPDADRGVSVDVSLPAYRRSEPGCRPLPARPSLCVATATGTRSARHSTCAWPPSYSLQIMAYWVEPHRDSSAADADNLVDGHSPARSSNCEGQVPLW
ncbi:unnamed protein product [Phytophthora lilii]|uniref:Unnamed protein product n=1 Tax=Phytophthora lilii TaxID=2077276 RepID=A0A9W6UA49_9STRA|nr:unnamed protein product [Phytophthora lilii]